MPLIITPVFLEFSPSEKVDSKMNDESLILQKIDITNESPIKAVSIRSSGIREKAKALIVGIERNGKRILNPDSSMIFEEGDIVWIVGNPKRIQSFLQGRKTEMSSIT